MLKLLPAIIILLYAVPVQAADESLTGIGSSGGNANVARQLSASGQIIAADGPVSTGENRVFRFDGTNFVDLGSLGGPGDDVFFSQMSLDGAIIGGEGSYINGSGLQDTYAYRWTGGTMTNLGTLGGSTASFGAMSSDGSVIGGSSTLTGNAVTHAYRWAGGVMTDIGTLGGDTANVSGISNDGSVLAGQSEVTPGGGDFKLYRWTGGGGMTNIDTLSTFGSNYVGMSNDGSVIAATGYDATDSEIHALRWTGGTMSDLGTLGGTYSNASAISDNGAVVAGTGTVAGDVDTHTFRWQGTMVDLGTLGGSNTYFTAMTSDGAVIAGQSQIAGDAATHAYRWENGTLADLGTLGGTDSNVKALSGNGSILAGGSQTTGNASNAYYRWSQADGMRSLDSILTNGGVNHADWDLSDTGDTMFVSADGRVIAGTALRNGVKQAFLFTGNATPATTPPVTTPPVTTPPVTTPPVTTPPVTTPPVTTPPVTTPPVTTPPVTTPPVTQGPVGLITPDELLASLRTTAVPIQQAQAAVNQGNDQSLSLARTARAAYFSRKTDQYTEKLTYLAPDPGLAEPEKFSRPTSPAGTLHPHYAVYGTGSLGAGQDDNFGNTATSGAAGVLLEVNDDTLIGGGIVGGHDDVETRLDGSSKVNAIGGAVFVAYAPSNGIRVYGAGNVSSLDVATKRHYVNGSDIDNSSGDTNGTGYGATTQIGYEMNLDGHNQLMPYGAVQASHTSLDGYTETGGAFAAVVGTQRGNAVTSHLGVELSHEFNDNVQMRVRGAWGHRLSASGDNLASSVGIDQTISTNEGDQNWAETGITGIWHAAPNVVLATDLAGRSGDTREPSLNVRSNLGFTF